MVSTVLPELYECQRGSPSLGRLEAASAAGTAPRHFLKVQLGVEGALAITATGIQAVDASVTRGSEGSN